MMMPTAGQSAAGVSVRDKGDSHLRNDVGNQLTFKTKDLVFDQQLAFFETLQSELVERDLFAKPRNDVVEITVFKSQPGQFLSYDLLFVHRRRSPILHPA